MTIFFTALFHRFFPTKFTFQKSTTTTATVAAKINIIFIVIAISIINFLDSSSDFNSVETAGKPLSTNVGCLGCCQTKKEV